MSLPQPTHVVVLDFDGTVTKVDVSDEICRQFASPAWREIDLAWERNELSLGEAQQRIWRLVRGSRNEVVGYAKKVGLLRAGLDRLLDAVRRTPPIQIWLASGGFDFYIQPILGERLGRFARAYFHKADFVAKRVELDFQHPALRCEKCALCKGKVVDLALGEGARVIFVGDGSSDRCVLDRHAHDRLTIYTIGGSFLERLCEERQIPHRTLRSIDEVLDLLPMTVF